MKTWVQFSVETPGPVDDRLCVQLEQGLCRGFEPSVGYVDGMLMVALRVDVGDKMTHGHVGLEVLDVLNSVFGESKPVAA